MLYQRYVIYGIIDLSNCLIAKQFTHYKLLHLHLTAATISYILELTLYIQVHVFIIL